MPTYAMVIDLQRCVGCGACSIACRSENNVSDGIYWSNKITETSGTFPHVRYHYTPTLCNHCDNAPCVKGCPTRAMHKLENGITMHDPKKCIGCRYCMFNCPYEVIYFNWQKPHTFWRESNSVIDGGTSSPRDLVRQVNGGAKRLPTTILNGNGRYRESRPNGVVEKCTFCDHLIGEGVLPYCVESLPSRCKNIRRSGQTRQQGALSPGKVQAFQAQGEPRHRAPGLLHSQFQPGKL